MASMHLAGQTVVFTGFRDDELQRKIEAGGGRVASSVSPRTHVLVASGSKGVQSAKAEKARELGVRVLSRDEFVAEFFPPPSASLWDRVLRRTPQQKQKQKATTTRKKSERCYLTHDNGGRPFKVCFDAHRFWVFKSSSAADDDDDEDEEHDAVAVAPTKHARAFVGRSPLTPQTKFSGGHGPKFDGNSVLFELPTDGPHPTRPTTTTPYVFVGECVRAFGTPSPIATFVSPVGNNDVPYPFAVDRAGVVYLVIEGVRLTAGPYAAEVLLDPYDFYYDRYTIVTHDGAARRGRSRSRSRRAEDPPFEGITAFSIGDKRYNFTWSPRPEQEFDRLSRPDRGDSSGASELYVVADGEKKRLSKGDFVGIMRRFGVQRGFAPLESELLVPRL